MAQAFQPGDTVRLKSGGPVMTVQSYDDPTGRVNCTWFAEVKKGQQQRQLESFVEATLEKAEPFKPTISTGRRVQRG